MALVSGGAASTRGVREASFWETAVRLQLFVEVNLVDLEGFYESCRVAELGRLSSGAKMAMKIFVKRVFTIFATNASLLRVIANLQI